MEEKNRKIKISVRNLVEFILRSGDLDNTRSRSDADAMQEGSRLHRKIQKRMGANYRAEVPLSITIPMERDHFEFDFIIEGRADGIIVSSDDESFSNLFMVEEETVRTEIIHRKEIDSTEIVGEESIIINENSANEELSNESQKKTFVAIDEIKCIYMDVNGLTEMNATHRAQVMCYAYIYANQHELEEIGIQLTYCQMETEMIRYFRERLSYEYLETWFQDLVSEYCKWAAWQISWQDARDASIKMIDFPFPYRPGQKDLVTGVYKTIIRNKKLFIEAPTGVGKTISTVFPTIKAMGEGLTSKIFYLTAKTITRTVAENTYQLLMERGLLLKVVTITSKEKICILEKSNCNPTACERAKGHFDRVNDAVFDLLTNETRIDRELIISYAKKHCVCPFEMCLDVTTWADAIICDYNYAFDPNVYLRRFFMNEKKQDYVFLIDEAHNLVERAREMYSATLYKKDFLAARKLVKDKANPLSKHLEICNNDLLRLKRDCDDCMVVEHIGDFAMHLLRLMAEYEEFFKEDIQIDGKEELLQLYFDVMQFLHIHEILDENYLIYTDYDESGEFRIKLLCMDPSKNLLACLNKGRSTVFFSATLLPIQYYKEQLGGSSEDYAIYAPSPFEVSKRLLMIANDVSTKYTRRNTTEYEKIVAYIREFTSAKCGNYFVFFPSYQMMHQISELAVPEVPGIILQGSGMSEEEKEGFLSQFEENPTSSKIGFCVMGGIFSEGIDLTKDRLIGAIIVGTGLPLVCNERELFRGFYDKRNGSGFDHAYLYQGMNKVLQSAGRVIRTVEDKGSILLLDERFRNSQYQNLFPREWFPYEVVDCNKMKENLKQFWEA